MIALAIIALIAGGAVGCYFFSDKSDQDEKQAEISDESIDNTVDSMPWTISYDGSEYIGTYTGEVENDIPNGEGTFSFEKDGTNFLYEGSWENGNLSGLGHLDTNNYLMHFPEFDKKGNYSGETKNGIPEGQGIFSAINKDNVKYEYTGEFKNGLYNGQGSQIWDDEYIIKEIGNFTDGKFCPSIIEGLNALGSRSPKFSVDTETEKVIEENLPYILGNGFDPYEVSPKINGSLSFAEYIKRPNDYLGQFVYWPGYTVAQVWVDDFFKTGYKYIEINAMDDSGHCVYAYGVDDGSSPILNNVNEDMYIEFVGIPLGTSYYENTGGGTTNCVVLLISFLNY